MQNIPTQFINYKNIKLGIFNFFTKQRKIIIPFLFIFSYILLYFLIDFSSQSLVAHDEGLYARRSRILEESYNWFSSPFPSPHHKTIGSYWFIALSIRLFGNSELALRLSSIIASFLCLITSYLIGVKISNKKSALISLFSLSSMPLWIQYSRYASPDLPFVLCILLVILFFLNYLDSSKYSYFYIFFSGFFISIAFFIRSYMVFVPIIGLSPFLLWNLFRSKNIFKIIFSSGIFIGLIPTFLSLYFSYKKFGIKAITVLFDFARQKAIGELDLTNILLVPLNYIYLTFPIGIFMVIFFVFTKSKININYPLLVYFYPLFSLIILLCMSTTYIHYYLFLLPPLSLLFSIQIQSYTFRFSISKTSIKYLLLAFILISISTLCFLFLYYNDLLIDYSREDLLLIYISSSILLFSFLFSITYIFDTRITQYNFIKFFYTLVVPQYISISLLYNFGIIGNPNNKLKSFLKDEKVSSIISNNTIYIFKVDSKINTLLSFYLPSSINIKSKEKIINYQYILTSNRKSLNSIEGKYIFKSIKNFDHHHLLMKINK